MRRAAPLLFLTLATCKPDFGERESLVTGTQVIAVRGDPPEARPNETVAYSFFVASPNGPVSVPDASWAFCATPKLLTENGAVSAACLGSGVRPIGTGTSVTAALPADACFLFGPETSSKDVRPRDPDPSGGFYQPVRVSTGTLAFGEERIRCNLANAPADVAADFAKRYVPNQNPELLPLEASVEGARVSLDAIPRGARITLRSPWSEPSAETYVAFDVATQTLAERREVLRLSWFVTTGSLDHDRTGVPENVWTSPAETTTAHVFVVLRDDRGGVAFASYDLATK